MKEFIAVFQLSKTVIFEVKYYTLGGNEHPYFTTSAARFANNKRDFSECGQAQQRLLKGRKAAMKFYKKWDVCHLKELTQSQYVEMREGLTHLKRVYNCMVRELDESTKPYSPGFPFSELAEWSKQEPKKSFKIRFEDNPSSPLMVTCKNKTEARENGNLYIKQWRLNTKIISIDEVIAV